MKKLLMICLAGATLFGYELKVAKEFSMPLKPDRGVLSFELFAKEQSAVAIKERFDPFVAKMKEFKQCRGGGYRIDPEYKYEKQTKTFNGYNGFMSFECKFKRVDELDLLTKEIENSKDVQVRQNPIRWIVDDMSVEMAQTSLELKAMKYAKRYAGVLKKEGIGRCEVKKVSVVQEDGAPSRPVVMRSASMQEPTKENIEVGIKANYVYKCE